MPSKLLLCLLLTLISAVSFAQKTDSRQKVFAAYPESVSLDRSLMNNAFTNKKDAAVSLQFSNDFVFKGTVVSNEQRYNNMQTLIVRSSENGNSLLQLTKITNDDKTISYAGRILNNSAADGYEIKNREGNYFLQKIQTQRILEPCNL